MRLRRGKGHKLAEAYEGLRSQAVGLRSESLGADVAADVPLAGLMEMGTRGGVATLVAIVDGSVSLYLSNGGGVIGAGRHKDIAAVGAEFLAALDSQRDLLEEVDEAALPQPGSVRFHLISDSGIRSAEVVEKQLRKKSTPLSKSYFAGQNLLTAVRLKKAAQG